MKMCEQSLKKIAGQVLTYNSKNFHWVNKQLDPERTMSEMENHFQRNQKNLKKKQKINVKMPHVNKKPLARNGNLVQTTN